MSPTPKELGVLPGDSVRVKSEFLPDEHSHKEVFTVIEAPAHGRGGAVVLEGKLTGYRISITADTDALTAKVS